MKNTWLVFLSIGFLSIVTFIFFFLQTQPIKLPDLSTITDVTQLEQPVLTFVNPSKGPQNAPITLVQFSDFECEACRTLATTLEAIHRLYPEDVRIVWKNFPNESLHPHATPAAIAAHCADRQGAFWSFHDQLFLNQTLLSATTYQTIAQNLTLDTKRFDECMRSQDTLAIVQKDFEEAKALHLSATPVLYIGSDVFVGAISQEDLSTMIKERLP